MRPQVEAAPGDAEHEQAREEGAEPAGDARDAERPEHVDDGAEEDGGAQGVAAGEPVLGAARTGTRHEPLGQGAQQEGADDGRRHEARKGMAEAPKTEPAERG